MTFRAYFNRRSEAPQVWSVDEGSQETEINVKGFVIHGCTVNAQFNGQRPNNDSPVAWIEIEADTYRILDGVVHFSRKAAA